MVLMLLMLLMLSLLIIVSDLFMLFGPFPTALGLHSTASVSFQKLAS